MSVVRGRPQPLEGGVRRGGTQKVWPRATTEDTTTFKLCTFCWAKVHAMLLKVDIAGWKNHAIQYEKLSKYSCRLPGAEQKERQFSKILSAHMWREMNSKATEEGGTYEHDHVSTHRYIDSLLTIHMSAIVEQT